MTTPLEYLLGAAGLGFVFGWIIYFAIRGRSGNISATEITAIFGALAGGAVTGFFSPGKPATASVEAIGYYGIGVFVGFAAYFCFAIYRESRRSPNATSDNMLDGVLETMTQSNVERGLRTGLLDVQDLEVNNLRNAAQSSPSQDARRCIVAIDELLIELSDKIISATGDQLNALVAAERRLTGLKVTCFAAIGLQALSSPEIRELSQTLTTETQSLQAEAAKLKNLTEQASKVTKLINLLGKLKSSVSALL